MSERTITKPKKKTNGFCDTGIFPLNTENFHLMRRIDLTDYSESPSRSVAQVTSESFELFPLFSYFFQRSIIQH